MRSPQYCGAQALVDPGAVGEQPAADHRLGQPRALLARCRGGEVAKPREALELLGERTVGTDLREIETGQRQTFAAEREAAGEQSVAALAVAVDVVARHRRELERLLRSLEAGEKRAARELADDVALGRRAVAGHPPRSARMLAA